MHKTVKLGALALAVAMSAPAFAADQTTPTNAPGIQVAAHKGVAHRRARPAAKPAAVREYKQPARWVYMAKRMRAPKNDKWRGRWDELGRDGWELVTQEERLCIFKRPADFGWAPAQATVAVAATPTEAVTKAKAKKAK